MRCTQIRRLLLASMAAVLLASAAVVAQATPGDELAARLGRLLQRLETERVRSRVPGLAIAVVKDDRVVLLRGLGVSDLAAKTPITPDTPFRIGSTTKAFTATLIGMLVDDGRMEWDDPVVRHLPALELHPAGAEPGEVTIRDLLAHRTGFARMPLLHASGTASAADVLSAVENAKPLFNLRERFQYSNVMYAVAGAAAASAGTAPWQTLLTARILKPLGMSSSRPSDGSAPVPGLTQGYLWNEDTGQLEPQTPVSLDAVGPAGSIVSTARDMAQWVRFQLNRGRHDGRSLIAEDTLAETWTKQIDIGGGRSYGLGWMVHDWMGQPVVEHGGNTRGYLSQVAFLPESGVGFVLLANVTSAPLQERSMALVWESLLAVDSGAEAVAPTEDLEPYLGTYLPTHRDAEFQVLERDGRLALLMPPSPQALDLRKTEDQGPPRFDLPNGMSVSFERDSDGRVVLMKIRQGPTEFECVRAGVVLPPEIDPATFERNLGTYRSSQSGTAVLVFVQNNRLALNVPGRVFELRPPGSDGLWRARLDGQLAVAFHEGADGVVSSITIHQPGGPAAELVRVAVPGLDDVRAVRQADRRRAALDRLGVFRLRGTVRSIHSGAVGTVEWHAAGTDRHRRQMDFGVFGRYGLLVNNGHAWVDEPGTPSTELRGRRLAEAIGNHPGVIHGAWADTFSSVTLLRTDTTGGRLEYVVRLEGSTVPSMTAYVDGDTGDVRRVESAVLDPTASVSIPVQTFFEDFRDVEGLSLPFRVIIRTPITGDLVMQFEAIDVRLAEAGVFGRRSTVGETGKSSQE